MDRNKHTIQQLLAAGEPLNPEQLTLQDNLLEDELGRLQALSEISEALNKSIDIREALENTLSTLLRVLHLQSGWISLRADSHLNVFQPGKAPPHGFVLAAASGLPPSLEADNRRYLRQPPACQCQRLLSEGRLTQAVNIVECTRLHDAHHAARKDEGLRYHATVPLISRDQQVGVINVASENWQFLTAADLHFLSAVGKQLVIALERAYLYEVEKAQNERFERELRMARLVQENLMPRQMPDIPGYNLASAWCPALEIGGDFYDVFPLGEDCWGIMIGDVVDKGPASALLMTLVHTLIRAEARQHDTPAAVLMAVNQAILQQCTAGIFVTVFLAMLDRKNHTLHYTNAGHSPPLVRHADGRIERLNNTGAVLGVLSDLQQRDSSIHLTPGSAVLMYTDGVPEATHPQDQEAYGIGRLEAVLASAPHQPQAMLAYLEADRIDFSGNTPQQDDVTYVVLSREA